MSSLSLQTQKKILDHLVPRGKVVCRVEDSQYSQGNKYWKVTSLLLVIKEQGCVKFKYDLADMDFSTEWHQFGKRITDVAYDAKRAIQSDLRYPIIFSPLGGVLDGTHRIMKALMEDRTWLYAYRLKTMPDADGDL